MGRACAQEKKRKRRCLRPLEPEKTCQIKGDWEEIELAVDSGATETVVGPKMIKGVTVTPSIHSIRGVMYEVANGVQIKKQR